MPKPRIDYDGVRRFILVMMADAFYRDENMEFDPARVQRRLPIPTNLIKVTFDKLEREGLVSEIGRQQTRPVGVIGERTVRDPCVKLRTMASAAEMEVVAARRPIRSWTVIALA